MSRTPARYALTISPPQRQQRSSFLFIDDVCALRKILNKCSNHYLIVPEYTYVDARLHYHGVIEVTDQIKWLKSSRKALNKIGFVLVKPLMSNLDSLRWLCYCYKDWHLAKAILKLDKPIMYERLKRKQPSQVSKRITIYDYL